TSNIKKPSVPAARVAPVTVRHDFKQQAEEEYLWLDHGKQFLEDNTATEDITFWAAFQASCYPPEARIICPIALFPLFLDSEHTVAMIRHSLDTVKNAVGHMNPGQTPVVNFGQPLFALAKQIQWKWQESFDEDVLVVMFDGLHIEMAAQRTL
ncbi:hypothetical protein LSAT2_017437, partial [Lamellibrachia satsuma]